MTFEQWQYWTGFTSGAPALRSYIYQDVGEPTCVSFSTTGMYAGKPLTYTMGNLGHLFTCGNRYVVVKRNWGLRGFHRSESVVFHLVFWMSSFFSCWVGVFVFWGLFSFLQSEGIRLFAFHLFSYNLRIVDRPQDVLMTVRASSAKKNLHTRPVHPRLSALQPTGTR